MPNAENRTGKMFCRNSFYNMRCMRAYMYIIVAEHSSVAHRMSVYRLTLGTTELIKEFRNLRQQGRKVVQSLYHNEISSFQVSVIDSRKVKIVTS